MLKIETWKKWIPVFTVALIITGNIYIYFYYLVFGIDIYDYVTTTDILSLFIEDFGIVTFLVLAFLFLLTQFVFIISTVFSGTKRVKKQSRINRLRILSRFRIWFKYRSLFLAIAMIFMFFLYFRYFSNLPKSYYKYILQYTMYFLSISLLILFYLIYLWERKRYITSNLIKFASLIFIVVAYVEIVSTAGDFKAFYAVNTKIDWKNTYYFKDTIITTNDSVRLIGTTNNNFFFHLNSRNNEKVLIYAKEDLLRSIQEPNKK